MTEQRRQEERVPWGQKFYDSPFILLILGVLVMFTIFTGWGLIEILTMPQATLP